jgi:hypothetical protein
MTKGSWLDGPHGTLSGDWLIKKIVEKYAGEPNDYVARDGIMKTIRTMFDHYDIDIYELVCDETNNTPEIIDDRKLVVNLNGFEYTLSSTITIETKRDTRYENG